MTWQNETTSATGAYRDFLVSIVAIATSNHVSAAVVNAGGSGYVVGDLLTISHAGAYHDCVLEVLTLSGSAVATVAVRKGGALSNRLASAVVNAGGSGYAVGDVLQVQGGTYTERVKVRVATLSGSAVATVTVFETGGAYSTAPGLTGAATVGIGPAGFAGNNAATLDLTMTGLIGTTGIAATGGTGTGATFDITLTDTGWTEQRNLNNRTENSVMDEKEVVLLGTVSGADAPYVGLTTYTQTSGLETRFGVALHGMTAFNPLMTGLATQPGIGPNGGVIGSSAGAHVPVHEAAREWWLSITPRKIAGAIRTTSTTVCYSTFYLGLGSQFGTSTTNPYPMVVAGSSNTANQVPDSANNTGLSECFRATSGGSGPVYFRRKSDGAWRTVQNGSNAAAPAQLDDDVMWPICSLQVVNTASVPEQQHALDGPVILTDGVFGSNVRANASNRIFPAPDTGDDVFVLWPLTILATAGSTANDQNTEIVCELDNVSWFGGTKSDGTTVAPEDFLDFGGVRYHIFPNGTQGVSAKPYQFMVMAEA